MTHSQNSEQNNNINLANKTFETVVNFKYLREAVTNKNYVPGEIKGRLNSMLN
jgi:hypothetical protein